ncbi:hypothetical protein GCM10023221_02170 [Luteimicrobium xylanilyticum]|uniref:Uncharacterized protein n=1 Tax=Luteimicrobium xylanilyticum TaxID=1133546 RepID=A0A5P9Q7S5_9MICO|nr:DUF4440 domain-containing protein [Luteimicrobium xylanilyticum]QFU97487.1 hypothetical protein KDY119_00985 [Luteimicrobium xylanilyticum]
MDDELITQMKRYFEAGLRMDLDELARVYAPEYVGVRVDLDGRSLEIPRDGLLAQLRKIASAGHAMPPVDDVEYLAAVRYGDHGSVALRRVKDGRPLLYEFVWRLADGEWRMVHEFTVETDLSALIAAVR